KTLVAELGKHPLKVVHVTGSDNPTTFRLASGVNAKFFTFPHAADGPEYKSVMMAVKFRHARFLFTGDVHDDYEKHLIQTNAADLPAHMLKITHHGSSSGTCQEFVDFVQPGIAVASSTSDPSHRLEAD